MRILEIQAFHGADEFDLLIEIVDGERMMSPGRLQDETQYEDPGNG